MAFAARLDELGRPAWIGLAILSFWLWKPLCLAVVGFLIGSGRMGCWKQERGQRWQRKMARMQARAAQWCGPGNGSGERARPSGNHAFDEYRAETLRRLEDEQREFMEFLERLRHAKDKAEFDQFMAERRRNAGDPIVPPPPG